MKFEYQAIDEKGHIHEGIEETSNFKSFIKIMLKKKLQPISIKKLNKTDLHTQKSMNHLMKLKNSLEGESPDEETDLDLAPKSHNPDRLVFGAYYVIMVIVLTAAMISYFVR